MVAEINLGKTIKGKKVKVYVPHRGRRESYIKNVANMIGQDAISDVLENRPEVYKALVDNNAKKGLPTSKNPLSIIKQRIDRDMDVMFSKTYAEASVDHKIIFGTLYARACCTRFFLISKKKILENITKITKIMCFF